MSCGVGLRHSLDPALLRLRHRPAATAPIRALAWEPPYAKGAALKKKKSGYNFKTYPKDDKLLSGDVYFLNALLRTWFQKLI